MRAKGRAPCGEEHGSAKLKAAQVRRIKALLAEGRMYISEIAREFGVSETTVRAISTGKTWKHVPGPGAPRRRGGAEKREPHHGDTEARRSS